MLLSKPLAILPTYLSAISMVGDDSEYTVRQLIQAERPSPPVYDPARDLFIRILQGNLSVERALLEVERLHAETERRCARDVIEAAKPFLEKAQPAKIGRLNRMEVALPNGLNFVVSPIWIRHLAVPCFLVLHFWQEPLSR